MNIGTVFFGLPDYIDSTGGWVDNRRRGYPDDWYYLCASGIGRRNRGRARREKACVPKRRSAGVGVECVNAVIFGRYIDDIVGSLVRDGHVRDVQRFCINLCINRVGEKLAKSRGVNVGRGKHGLGHDRAGPLVVVVLGEDTAGRTRGVSYPRGSGQCTWCDGEQDHYREIESRAPRTKLFSCRISGWRRSAKHTLRTKDFTRCDHGL